MPRIKSIFTKKEMKLMKYISFQVVALVMSYLGSIIKSIDFMIREATLATWTLVNPP